jgi:ADP-ribosyl-[dinitrogen reductase] hydrolase
VEDGVYTCTGRCIGIDETTRRALSRYKETENPVAGDRHADNLSSGSLVRLAPVAIRYWADRTELRDAAVRQSRTTHAGPAEVDACLAFAEVLGDAIRGASRITVFGERYVPGASSVERIMQGSWKNRPREAIRSDGNVLNALEAAIWCVDRSETFDEAVLLAVNLGDKTARTAALAGQLAGALYGACTIRPSWLERLAKRDHICEQVDRLFKQSRPGKRRSG